MTRKTWAADMAEQLARAREREQASAETVGRIVAWLQDLAKTVTNETAAQIEAIADAILEERWVPDVNVREQLTALRGGWISVGPVTLDVEMARRFGWTEPQIARSWLVCSASSRLENRIVNHRQGYTRICPDCEQWTVPEGECHLCAADRSRT